MDSSEVRTPQSLELYRAGSLTNYWLEAAAALDLPRLVSVRQH